MENAVASLLKVEEKNKFLLESEKEERKKEIQMFQKAQDDARRDKRRTDLQMSALHLMQSRNKLAATDGVRHQTPKKYELVTSDHSPSKSASPTKYGIKRPGENLRIMKAKHDKWNEMFQEKMNEVDQQIENQKSKLKKFQDSKI